MTQKVYELNPVQAITAGAVGEPGHRVFYIQARALEEIVTLIAEKEQVQMLARGIYQFLDEIDEKYPMESEGEAVGPLDLELRGPFEPHFRVAQMGLGYDSDAGLVVLVAHELVPEENESESESDPEIGDLTMPEPESGSASVARFWASRSQMRAMADHALEVAARGRPLCPLCGRPEDPDGHFCPKRNGHSQTLLTP
jgi:uncharacterized repeat protein (TIGR03847 family)